MTDAPQIEDSARDSLEPMHPVVRAMWDERLRRDKEGKPSAVEIMAVIDDELNRILASQRAMIDGAVRIEPYAPDIRKAVVYEHALLLLQNIIKNADRLRPILYPKATRK